MLTKRSTLNRDNAAGVDSEYKQQNILNNFFFAQNINIFFNTMFCKTKCSLILVLFSLAPTTELVKVREGEWGEKIFVLVLCVVVSFLHRGCYRTP